MTNVLGPQASALAEAMGDGVTEVRALPRQRELEAEEILGPEEFEALLLEGSATFEPSSAANSPAKSTTRVRPTQTTRQNLRASDTWPKLEARAPRDSLASSVASDNVTPRVTRDQFPTSTEPHTLRIEPLNPRATHASTPAADDSNQEVATLRAELTRLSRQMRARDAYLQELERALEHNRRELAAAGLSTGLTAARLFGRMRGQAFRIAELETDLRQAQLSLATLRASHQSPSANQRDDLRSIRGIGPRFAEQLGELGFNTFESIATLSADDMVRIATRLRISSDRIERDAWVEQARSLMATHPRSHGE